MKKDYLKPEMEVMEFVSEMYMQSASNNNNIGEGDPDQPLDTNNRRGSWGDLWN